MSYQYCDLATPTSTRLLVLSGNQEAPSYAIEEVDLDSKPRYEALSYTWKNYHTNCAADAEGDYHSYASIYIAGTGDLSITSHLVEILRHIHDIVVQPGSSGKLWCDQISVNQKNLGERSLQVSLMGKIYSQAERTLLWPGECDEHAPAFTDLLRRFYALPFDWSDKSLNLRETIIKKVETIFLQEDPSSIPVYTKQQYSESVACILKRPYFKRGWIVQEIVLSSQPTIIVDSIYHDIQKLYRLLVYLVVLENGSFGEFEWQKIDFYGFYRLGGFAKARAWLRGDYLASDRIQDFLDILIAFSSGSEFSDPRDHVYAFLALQKDLASLPVPADYAVSVARIYTIFSAYLARKTGSLLFLGVISGSEDPYIPSWAVDWRRKSEDRFQGDRIDKTRGRPYSAAKGRSYCAKTQRDDTRLVVEGRTIDTVQNVSCLNRRFMESFPMELVQLAEEVSNFHSLVSTEDFNEPRTLDNLTARAFATLLQHDYGPDAAPHHELEELLPMYTTFVETHKHDAIHDSLFMSHFNYLPNFSSFKRLFVGTKKLFGLGPNHVLPGDKIFILHGSKVPVLLRPCENGRVYTVVGQCFYEMWMYSEQVNWEEDEADEIVLV